MPTWPVVCRVILPRRVLWLLVAFAVASAARFFLKLPLFVFTVIVEQICKRAASGAHQGHEQARTPLRGDKKKKTVFMPSMHQVLL